MVLLATGWGGRLFFALSQKYHLMRTKNLAVLPRTAALSGQRERIRTLVVNQLRRVLHRYHLRVCAITDICMSQATAVRAGLAMLCGALTLITAECLPLCMLFLSLTLLIAQPWRK
jgi:Holliday junction resolvasome RuvABC endonuclease subunit